MIKGKFDPLESSRLYQANTDHSTVVKNYVVPFKARYVRFYPWSCSHYLFARVEIYAQLSPFGWSPIGNIDLAGSSTFVPQRAQPIDKFCMKGSALQKLRGLFQRWNDGMNGNGVVYESLKRKVTVQANQYLLTALQRRNLVELQVGMLVKSMICFEGSNAGNGCCVQKDTNLAPNPDLGR